MISSDFRLLRKYATFRGIIKSPVKDPIAPTVLWKQQGVCFIFFAIRLFTLQVARFQEAMRPFSPQPERFFGLTGRLFCSRVLPEESIKKLLRRLSAKL